MSARQFYAEEIAAVTGLEDARLVAAFARVPREAFLGPGPWDIVVFGDGGSRRYRRTPDADPAHLYHNVVVAIDPARELNNGQPGALATWIGALSLRPGDEALHVGCGTGYYTAIIAETCARVDAMEIDPALAARARANLAPWSNARVIDTIGGPYDAILINAGATHVLARWLDALKPEGRLLVPITIPIPGQPHGSGLMLEVRGEGARFTTPLSIFDCAGARDASLEPALKALFATGGWRAVRRLRRDSHVPEPSCALHTAEVCLTR